MKKRHYILTCPNRRPLTEVDLNYVNEHVTVLGQSRCAVLVEDTAAHLRQFLQSLPGWRVQPEYLYKLLKPTALRLPS